jgi:hypothetical protein
VHCSRGRTEAGVGHHAVRHGGAHGLARPDDATRDLLPSPRGDRDRALGAPLQVHPPAAAPRQADRADGAVRLRRRAVVDHDPRVGVVARGAGPAPQGELAVRHSLAVEEVLRPPVPRHVRHPVVGLLGNQPVRRVEPVDEDRIGEVLVQVELHPPFQHVTGLAGQVAEVDAQGRVDGIGEGEPESLAVVLDIVGYEDRGQLLVPRGPSQRDPCDSPAKAPAREHLLLSLGRPRGARVPARSEPLREYRPVTFREQPSPVALGRQALGIDRHDVEVVPPPDRPGGFVRDSRDVHGQCSSGGQGAVGRPTSSRSRAESGPQ